MVLDWAGKILQGLAVAFLLWIGSTIYNVDKTVSNLEQRAMYTQDLDKVQTEQILSIQKQVNNIVTDIEVIKNDIRRLKVHDRRSDPNANKKEG